MAIHRLDHVSVVVDDLDAAVAFFVALGMEVEGRQSLSGEPVDRLSGLDDVRAEIVMVRTPDGVGRLELTRFASPPALAPGTDAPPNTLGLRSLMFAVDDLEEVLARLRPHGAELVGEVVRYADAYVLCYVRGPAGVIVALAEPLG